MRQTETYKLSLIEMSDPFSPDVLNRNAETVDKALKEIAPAGSIFWYAKETAPDGYLICDGSAISRTDYARLFDAIGTAFGEGDGEETFALPDLRAAFIRGAGTSGKYSATFGEKQNASSIGGVNSVASISVADCDFTDITRVASANINSGSSFGDCNVNQRIRPYNIALTPIIKY